MNRVDTHTNVKKSSPHLFRYTLVVRQQPCKARLCSFKEKVDRRPIDPPPIIELASNSSNDDFLQNPYFFLYATLTDASGESDLHFVNGNRSTAGTVVQSLHRLKDIDNTDGGFFIFSDVSVRLEGFYRLKFTLYEIEGDTVSRVCSIVSDTFQVYSPKSFPGMSESTFLTRSFSDQGVRIRIRKEPRSSTSNSSHCGKKRRKLEDDSADEGYSPPFHDSPLPTKFYQSQPYYGRSPSPLPELDRYETNKYEMRPTLPSPKEIFRASPMSMQNILTSDSLQQQQQTLFPHEDGRFFATRKLPLPLPSTPQQQEDIDWLKSRLTYPSKRV